jgi:hypothetical protein
LSLLDYLLDAMSDETPSNQIASTIAEQIGAGAFRMMGTRQKVSLSGDLIFDIQGCVRFNRIRVHLSGMDDYTVTFSRMMGTEVVRQEVAEEVYADKLHEVIEAHTGLSLSLPDIVFSAAA